MATKKSTPAEVAAFFGCTEEQARAQMLANVRSFEECEEKAASAKKGKYRGYTANEWRAEIDATNLAISNK